MNTSNNGRNWKTREEIAAHYNVSPRTISNYMKRRILPYVKIDGVVRFDLEECDRAMEKFMIRSILLP